MCLFDDVVVAVAATATASAEVFVIVVGVVDVVVFMACIYSQNCLANDSLACFSSLFVFFKQIAVSVARTIKNLS